MGLILWEILSGRVVGLNDDGSALTAGQMVAKFTKKERPALSAVPDSVDPEVVALMQACWAEDPSQRPTAEELWKRMSVLDVNNPEFNQPLVAYRDSWLIYPCSFEDCLQKALPQSTYQRLLLDLPRIEAKYRTEQVKQVAQSCEISEVEAKCIIVYTLVWPPDVCPRSEQLYFLFCKAYRDRDQIMLQRFSHFSFHFWNGLGKLPKRKEQLFRGLDKRLMDVSDLYEVDNVVHWHYPSSATTDMKVASEFSNGGTLISFDQVQDAVSIETFSLVPSEREFMLSYESVFDVKIALSSDRARLLGAFGSLPDNVDLVVLQARRKPSL